MEIASPLREITCYMGSQIVTYHPAAVTFPPLPQSKLVLELSTPEGCNAELTYVVVISQDRLPTKYGSPISEITGKCHGWELKQQPKVASPPS